jgi:hypothetical protein
MKKSLFNSKHLIITSLLFFISSSFILKNVAKKEDEHFAFKIMQDEKEIPIIDHSVTINSKEFELLFEFNQPMSVCVQASFNSINYDLILANTPLEKIPVFDATGMAEGLYNTEKSMFLSEEGFNYWYFDNKNENRFNKIEQNKNTLFCTRTIDNLYDVEKDKKIKLKSNKSTLYLIFINYKYNKDFTEKNEIQRDYLKINFK